MGLFGDAELIDVRADNMTVWAISRHGSMITKWQVHVPAMTLDVWTEDASKPGTVVLHHQAGVRRTELGRWEWIYTWDSYYRMTALINQRLGSFLWKLAHGEWLSAMAADLSTGPRWKPFKYGDDVEQVLVEKMETIYRTLYQPTPPRYCTSCTTQQEADAVFCKRCGARVDGAPPAEVPTDGDHPASDKLRAGDAHSARKATKPRRKGPPPEAGVVLYTCAQCQTKNDSRFKTCEKCNAPLQ